MEKTICWLDTETTGKNRATDRIIQLSLIRTLGLHEVIDKKKLYINPDGVPIHPEASSVHGITEEMVSKCLMFKQIAKPIHDFIQTCDAVGGFNIKDFDIPLLAEEFARGGIDWKVKQVIDNSVIFKRKEQRNLTAALKFYCGMEMDGAHDAENDVVATINIAVGQVYKYGFDVLLDEGQTEVDVLIAESSYDNEKPKVDYHNKIVLDEQQNLVWNFGKNIGKNIKSDLGYVDWVLGLNDFPGTTKNLIRNALQTKA